MSEQARKELAETIKALRKLKHLSQEKLAEKAGVSKMVVNAIENGGNTTLETLDKIGEALGHELY